MSVGWALWVWCEISLAVTRPFSLQCLQERGYISTVRCAGAVNKGVWHCPRNQQDVAIKLLQDGAPEQDRVKFPTSSHCLE